MVIPITLGLVHNGETSVHCPAPGLCDGWVVVIAAADGIFAFDERQALRFTLRERLIHTKQLWRRNALRRPITA